MGANSIMSKLCFQEEHPIFEIKYSTIMDIESCLTRAEKQNEKFCAEETFEKGDKTKTDSCSLHWEPHK